MIDQPGPPDPTAPSADRESDARQAFRNRVGDALRYVSSALEAPRLACELLGEFLGVNRVCFGEIEGEDVVFRGSWEHDVPPLPPRLAYAAYGRTLVDAFIRGETVVIDDVMTDPRLSEVDRLQWIAARIRSTVGTTLLDDGVWVAGFTVQSSDPRHWKPSDVALIRETAERAWAALQRARAEEALRESERRLSVIFETLPVGVGLVKPGGTVVLANQEMMRYLPSRTVPSRDPANQGRWRGYHPDGRRIEPGDYPSARVLRGERVVPGVEFQYLQEDGTEVWTRVAALPVPDADGHVAEVVAVVTDIDALKRTQEALRENEARLRSLLETLEERVRSRTSELAGANAALQGEVQVRQAAELQIKALFRRLVSVQEDERRRIARDIHDQLGQPLTALRLKLELLRNDARLPADLVELVERIQRVSSEIDISVDAITWQLRPAALDHLGLSAALARLAEGWSRRFGLAAEYGFAGSEPPPHAPEIDANIYNIAQEALHNVYKHAQATHVSILLQHIGDALQLTVEDDGVGFDAATVVQDGKDRLGLAGMRERAALVGGTLEVETSRHGTTVLVRVPLGAPRPAEGGV